MNDQKTTETPLTDEKMMAALAESADRMNNMSESERKRHHRHALKLIYAGEEMEELEKTKKALTAARSRLESSELREAELAKALEEIAILAPREKPELDDFRTNYKDVEHAYWTTGQIAKAALHSPASQNNPKETKA